MQQNISPKRPAWRFAPQAGWINDPNGLVYDGRHYHLFAQHNPNETIWGPMHWLHAVSDDLLHWREQGIVLYPNDLGSIFSGSAVVDVHNTAGFGAGAVVALFTQHGATECQSLAYMLDGEHFTLYEGNPVIANPGCPDFRDPKVFWHASTQDWRMVLAAGDCLEFYASADLRQWRKTGEFGRTQKGSEGVYECPDLFPLVAPNGDTAWVLLASIGAPPEAGGCRMHYFIGTYDGTCFCETETAAGLRRVDAGADDYAGVTFSGTEERFYLGWAANPHYAGRVPAVAYRGSFTLPRKLRLAQTEAGLCLAAEPVLPTLRDVDLGAGGAVPSGVWVLKLLAMGEFEVRLSNRLGEVLRFGCDEAGLFADRTQAGQRDFDDWFGRAPYAVSHTPRRLSGPVEMLLVWDGLLAEVYADQGTYVQTMLAYPGMSYDRLEVQGAVRAQLAVAE